MQDFYYNGLWRMDWGLGSPNKTAALIAMLMISVWWIHGWRRKYFIAVLFAFTLLGFCLVHTVSRGGLLAAGVGLAVAAIGSLKAWNRRGVVLCALAAVAVAGFAVITDAASRYGSGIKSEDRSISNRFRIWEKSSQMILDAPNGWGVGNAGSAYVQWYQELDDSERYRTLVNSHLTWLAEFSLIGKCFYVAAWALAMILCWPYGDSPSRALGLGTICSFFVAASFSSVGEARLIWVLPVIIVTSTAVARLRDGRNIVSLAAVSFASIAWGTFFGGLIAIQKPTAEMRVSGPAITVGSGASDRLVVATKESFGDLYGKKLRSYFAGNPGAKSVTVVSNVDVIPRNNSFNILAVSGSETPENLNKLRDRFKCIRKLIVFAPTYAPEAISSVWAEDVEKIAVYGEFSQSFYVDLWQQRKLAYRVEAMGDFIPDWPALIERLNNVGSFQ